MAETKAISPKVNVSSEKPVFSWQSPEFIRYERDHRWTLAIIGVAVVLAVILGFQSQWSGVGVVVAAALIFIFLSGTKPKNVKCAVYPEGIVVDDKVYDFSQFKSFWLIIGDMTKIRLQLTGRFSGVVTMPMKDEDPEQIRLFIGKHLPESDEQREDATDLINRILRF